MYNKTFLFLYRFSVVDLYNYPLFFNIIQLIIYTIFFALFTQVLFKKTHSFLNHPKLRLSVFRANFSKFFAVIVLIVIIVPSIPILENPGGALNNTPKNVSMPSYVNCMAGFFKDRQNSKVLILPSNVTTLNYLDYMVPYHNVYGFPYDYQVFPSEFPNVSVFSNLTNAFYNSNHSEISTILESQRVGYVVVLNPTQAYPIVPAQTSVNGGGKNFARIMNGTRNYSPLVITENYIIYSFTNLGNYSIPHFSFNYQSLYTNFTKYKAINNVPSVKIVSGNYSHADLPVHINLPAGIAPEPYFTYQTYE